MEFNPKEIEIRKLLELYWEGETTLEQERDLKEFFLYAQVPEDLREDAAYFKATMEMDPEVLGEDFEEDVMKHIQGGSSGRVLRMNFAQSYWKQIAAAVVILAIGSWFIWGVGVDKQNHKEYTAEGQVEPEEVQAAFEETKRAMFMLSNGFQKGKKEVQHIEKFNEATQQVKQISYE